MLLFLLLLGNHIPGVDDTGDPAQAAEQNVDHCVSKSALVSSILVYRHNARKSAPQPAFRMTETNGRKMARR